MVLGIAGWVPLHPTLPPRGGYVFSDMPQIAGDASGPRLWILLTPSRSVARDQEQSGYPGRSLSRTQKINRTAGPSYTCHAERSEASQRYVAEGPAAQYPRGVPLRAPDVAFP